MAHDADPPANGSLGTREPVKFGTSEVICRSLDDGTILMRSTAQLGPFAERVGDWLDEWARVRPEQAFIVEQMPQGERVLTYGEAHRRVRAVAGGLLSLREDATAAPLLTLAGNTVDHAVAILAALYIGMPVAPIAPAYALQASDFGKLTHCLRLLEPAVILVEDGARYQSALATACDFDVPIVAIRNAEPSAGMIAMATLEQNTSAVEVERRARAVGPDTVAKYFFTSGSTGMPKAVINTHRMLCANAQMHRQVLAYVATEPPTMIDWLPWNHTAGGNANFNLVFANGGTLYIDPGKPLPGAIDATMALLRRVSPTTFFNVPMGYDAMLPYLEADAALRESFFGRLRFMWYAAASMKPSTWRALERLATQTVGERVLIASSLGMTETAPLALHGNPIASDVGVVGVPAPGVELKLVPHGGHFEARYRGPNVTPGYVKNPTANATAFDEDGFFRSGDLLSFVDPAEPERGMRFEGRISDDFKLASGTRVSAGSLRLGALEALRPLAAEVVIVGEGRDDVRMIIFPDWQQTALAVGVDHDQGPAQLAADPRVRALLTQRLSAVNGAGASSSSRIVAATIAVHALSAEAGELSEKGTANARVVQRNRADAIDVLFASSIDDHARGALLLW